MSLFSVLRQNMKELKILRVTFMQTPRADQFMSFFLTLGKI